MIAKQLVYLSDAQAAGIVMDVEANKHDQRRISARDSSVQVFTIPADEDLIIARHTVAALVECRADD